MKISNFCRDKTYPKCEFLVQLWPQFTPWRWPKLEIAIGLLFPYALFGRFFWLQMGPGSKIKRSHLMLAAPLDETPWCGEGAYLTKRFQPSGSTRRARWGDAATFTKDKHIFFIPMPMTWFKVEEFRLE